MVEVSTKDGFAVSAAGVLAVCETGAMEPHPALVMPAQEPQQ